MNQIIVGIRKEILFFTRSFRFLGIIATFLGCAVCMPLMCALMESMSDVITEFSPSSESSNASENPPASETIQDFTLFEVPEDPDAPSNEMDLGAVFSGDIGSMLSMYSGENGKFISYIATLAMFGDAGAGLITLILLMGTAGQEQKKRSIIMPQTAGLTASGYVLPKFILYPPLCFVLVILSALFSNGLCGLFLGTAYSTGMVLTTSALIGAYLMYSVSLYMFLGISLVQPGLSVIYVLASNTIFGMLIPSVFSVDKFTPWNLAGIANAMILNDSSGRNIYDGIGSDAAAATALVAIALSVIFTVLAWFSMVAKKTDNTADEVY